MTRRQQPFLFRLTPRVKIHLYPDSELCRLIYCSGFEQAERDFTRRFLRPGDVYVDVGANIGLFTLLAADRVGLAGRVYAFEPAPRTFQRLLDNVRRNRLDQVSAHQLALSDAPALLPMAVAAKGYDAWNSLAAPYMGDSYATENVQAATWDDFAESNALVGRVALMKIDVEGWETRVLGGAKNTLQRPDAPTLMVEFTDQAALAAGTSCRRLYDSLLELGYRTYVADLAAGTLIPDGPRQEYPYLNLIATKHPRLVEQRLLPVPRRAP